MLKSGLDGRMRHGVEFVVGRARRVSVMVRDLVEPTYLAAGQPLQLNLARLDFRALV